MPIYEYECPECKTLIEVMAPIKGAVPPLHCGVSAMKRVSACTFHLKGRDWTNPVKTVPDISSEIQAMSDAELNLSLGLPEDH